MSRTRKLREVNWGKERDWTETRVIYAGVRRVKLNDKPGQEQLGASGSGGPCFGQL